MISAVKGRKAINQKNCNMVPLHCAPEALAKYLMEGQGNINRNYISFYAFSNCKIILTCGHTSCVNEILTEGLGRQAVCGP